MTEISGETVQIAKVTKANDARRFAASAVFSAKRFKTTSALHCNSNARS